MAMVYGCNWWGKGCNCSSFLSSPSLAVADVKKILPRSRRALIVSASSLSESNDNDNKTVSVSVSSTSGTRQAVKGSATTARGRRLLRIREERQQREYDRLHKYPAWAKVLEDACKDDTELRAVLGDSIGNPELMRKRVEDRVRKKGRDFRKSKTGSVLAFKVSFRE